MKYLIVVLVLLFVFSPVYAEDDYLLIGKIGLLKPVQLIIDSDSASQSYFYDLTELQDGVGRLAGTSWGNTVDKGRTILVGHNTGAFIRLNELEIGDQIVLSMNGETYTFYIFDRYITNKENGSVISTPAYQFEVVLITCTEDDRRLILKAK